ncbi:hypothetical protein M8C21_028383 [Ambrosia artemisiifolia]|uniref:Uncharacterized protein n=1 Tax=Ambrosia artemisiifolia TaxID=4212 RepID=A0AAD5C7K7_AMBAR|nr:hypothetical protein M8C21_028383 [Ambrosia artemisiifolia]
MVEGRENDGAEIEESHSRFCLFVINFTHNYTVQMSFLGINIDLSGSRFATGYLYGKKWRNLSSQEFSSSRSTGSSFFLKKKEDYIIQFKVFSSFFRIMVLQEKP